MGFPAMGYFQSIGLHLSNRRVMWLLGIWFWSLPWGSMEAWGLEICIVLLLILKSITDHYTQIIERVTAQVNLQIHSPLTNHLPPQKIPSTAALEHAIHSLVEQSIRHHRLMKLVKEVASICNRNEPMDRVINSAITAIFKSTGWPVATRIDTQLEFINNNYKVEVYFSPELPDHQRQFIRADAAFSEPHLARIIEQINTFRTPLWRKTKVPEGPGRFQFYLPVIAFRKVKSVIVLWGIPLTDFDQEFMTAMTTIGLELGRVAERFSRQEMDAQANQSMMVTTKVAGIGEIASRVAHEINNPLSVIVGRADQLAQYTGEHHPKEKTMQRMLTSISHNAERIATTISALKNISYEESIKELQEVSLSEIIHEAFNTVIDKAHRLGIHLRLPTKTVDAVIQGRRTHLNQLMINLVNAALDAAAKTEEPFVEVSLEQDMNSVTVTITENGHQESYEAREFLMDPNRVYESIEHGYGLSFFIAAKIAELHYGKLSLKRIDGKNYTILRLPWIQPQTQALSPSA